MPAFRAEGAKVAVADINFAEAKKMADGIEGAIAIELDVTKQASIDAMVDKVNAEFGRIDILVNNAAVFTLAPMLEITRADYQKVFAVNVEGLLFTLQTVAKSMVAKGTKGPDRQHGQPGRPARRGAGRRLLRLQGRRHQPDPVLRPRPDQGRHPRQRHRAGRRRHPDVGRGRRQVRRLRKPEIGEKKKQVGLAVPYGRMGFPEDLAGAAVFLASDDAEYVVAQTLNVDGGNWMS